MSEGKKEKVVVSVPMILRMLEEGKDRAVIGEELGLSGADVKRMFQHPDLKGKKVKKYIEPAFVFEEELASETQTVATIDDILEEPEEVVEMIEDLDEMLEEKEGDQGGSWGAPSETEEPTV